MNKFKQFFLSFGKDFLGFVLLLLFLILFFNIESFKSERYGFTVPDAWLNVNTIFLGIVIEAVPFILLGVFVSALIQIYVKEDIIHKYLPKNAYAALLPAAILGAIFPICECAIVPIVRRLIKKGMPLHVGVVFLVAAPILNPVVAASTFFAFRTDLTVLYARMGLAFVLSIIIGGILYLVFKNRDQLKWTKEEFVGRQVVLETSATAPRKMNRFKQTLYHAADEFFLMGKFLILGAFIAALFQTFLDRSLLQAIGSNEFSSTAVMMAFAFLLSLCSEADAFVAASFGSTFTTGSIIAFLVYGPMLDLKNTIMLFAFFKAKFVLVFIAVVTAIVFIAVVALQLLAIF
ncbi:possible permease [Halalkalibacter wakoensis JCM 9140]|uniref:Possible permease n=1 Tax=Halalkalibacter wakoensis JCM 9140 TaxID=1236970 RepID=W4Q261_9BACI|nr:permease [Halalkalibacter wakoensis]GAE25439.1 possible permease [Halalkalibacter wakoensis JCM 9140]